jgi:hypothetical protein
MNDHRLELLACQWGRRPKGAPTFGDLAGAVRVVGRADGALVVEYEPAAADRLAGLVAAERLCCAGIGWELVGATLRITAPPAQLDLLEQVVRAG